MTRVIPAHAHQSAAVVADVAAPSTTAVVAAAGVAFTMFVSVAVDVTVVVSVAEDVTVVVSVAVDVTFSHVSQGMSLLPPQSNLTALHAV
eukprot:CAMPEP_0115584138 /NCGR_PEP_ID=MMETSP0272-20121206/6529_1 /TAXON_ID=71861 /ORGANISM="Scrippsiella trochoidea, Strain CCMP3099" /LENGTH=89 /DNA_ID=CAMNT_0003019163 /DNA_START=565 /DNA_END=834 /DNA_ORIENTATION=+